ncbi:MAG TPA: hypothetical protein VIP82_12820 [Microbacterium sp.]|jgi:hypothetical protein|uniref:hypothetical protein n=1 Tax=Microbacterium sp. TaxID=51671 RepID=UPI002F955E7F
MFRTRVPARRLLAGGTTGVLLAVSVLHLAAAATGDPGRNSAAMVSAALGVAGLVTVGRLIAVRCFESRLAIVLIGGATLLGVWLTHTIGAPGSAPVSWSARDALLTVLAAGLAASWPATAAARTGDACRR